MTHVWLLWMYNKYDIIRKLSNFISWSKMFGLFCPSCIISHVEVCIFFTTAICQTWYCSCSMFMNTRSCCMELEIDVSWILEVLLTICMHRSALIWLMLLEISRFACTTGMWILQRGALTSTWTVARAAWAGLTCTGNMPAMIFRSFSVRLRNGIFFL